MNNLEEGIVVPNEVEEIKLEKDAKELATKTTEMQIVNQTDYVNATEFLKEVKTQAKVIENFFKDMKASANKAWKDICAKEKSYLNPLETAEAKVKQLMVAYQMEQERSKRLAEAKELMAQQKKIDQLKAKGKEDEAEALASQSVQVVEQEKVEGISYQVDYEIVIVDEAKVPVEVSGTVIRPVDTAVIKQLAKVSKGNIKIDGIEIRETKVAKVRV